MSDDLRRRFQDKIHGRPPHPGRAAVPGAASAGAALPPDALRVHAVSHGVFPPLADLDTHFRPDARSIRMTIDLGRDLVRDTGPEAVTESLRSLCRGLASHGCGVAGGIARPLGGGMSTAHLVEHVALDLYAGAGGRAAGAGAACAYRDRPGRFDVFLSCDDAPLGRTAALLAAAAVRDARRRPDRLGLHRRCADLLGIVSRSPRRMFAREDVAGPEDPAAGGTVETLEALVRLGYLEPLAAPLTFSSAAGILYRRVRAAPA